MGSSCCLDNTGALILPGSIPDEGRGFHWPWHVYFGDVVCQRQTKVSKCTFFFKLIQSLCILNQFVTTWMLSNWTYGIVIWTDEATHVVFIFTSCMCLVITMICWILHTPRTDGTILIKSDTMALPSYAIYLRGLLYKRHSGCSYHWYRFWWCIRCWI